MHVHKQKQLHKNERCQAFRFVDDYNKRCMVWPDPYLVPSLCDPQIEQTIHGLSRKAARIHGLSSAIHGFIVTDPWFAYNIYNTLKHLPLGMLQFIIPHGGDLTMQYLFFDRQIFHTDYLQFIYMCQ